MKEQIRNLRIKIDGLSQLVKSLHEPLKHLVISPSQNMGIEEMVKLMRETGITHFESLKPISITSSHNELSKCFDSLILAKAWLGKVLGELGESTPYKNDGKKKTVDDIEPPADKNSMIEMNTNKPIFEENGWVNKSHIEKVDWLRQEIQKILIETGCASKLQLQYFKENPKINKQSLNISKYLETYEQHLCEARFWLGFELQRIKEN